MPFIANTHARAGLKTAGIGLRGACAAALLALLVTGPGGAAASLVEKIVVVVNGDPHTFSDLREFSRTQLRRDVEIDELTAGRVPKEVVEDFITRELIRAEVRNTGIRVGDGDIDRYIQSVRERNDLTPAQFDALLKRDGKTMRQYREEVRARIEQDELIQRNVRRRVHITLQDAQRYYDANPHLYRTELKVRLRHLMLALDEGASSEQEQSVLARIGDLRRQVVDGADFAALARTHSQGAGASEGGDIGWVEPESLPDSLARVAAVLKKGEISEPVRTSLGYHLVRAEDRQGGERLGFAAVSEKARDELYNKTLQERFAKWLKTDLRKKHRVEVKLDGYAFEAQKAERGTVGSLVASATAGEEERGFWDYLNPVTYIYDEEVIRDTSGVVGDRKRIKLFGIPLFTTEAGDDDDVPLDQPFERGAAAPAEGGGSGASP